MRGTPAVPSWLSALVLAACVISGEAFAQEKPSEPPPESTLLVPESVVRAMEIYEAYPENTAKSTELVREYLQSLPSEEYAAFVAYFEQQAELTLQAAEERYTVESQVDPEGALKRYEEALLQAEGYDGTEPRNVPLTFEPPPDRYVPTPEELEDSGVNPNSPPPPSYDAGSGGGTDAGVGGEADAGVDGGSGGGGRLEPVCELDPTQEGCTRTPTDPLPPTCGTYTDRFGQEWTRCDTRQVAYVYIHGAGDHDSYVGSSGGYWGWSTDLGGTVEGVDRFFVSWDSTRSVQSQAGTVRRALDALCAPLRPCVVVTHSAGSLMMGHLLARGGSWNILRVLSVQGAAGGSELASLTMAHPYLWILNSLGLLQWLGSYPIFSLSLPVPIARLMYQHDSTNGVPIINYASEEERGYRKCKLYQLACHLDNTWSSLVNSTLRNFYNGGSDWLVAYHSSIGFRGDNQLAANTSCNPDSPASWRGYGVPYRNVTERYNHYWINHSAYHWQPPGQAFTCRRGVVFQQHSARRMLESLPALR